MGGNVNSKMGGNCVGTGCVCVCVCVCVGGMGIMWEPKHG